MSPQTGSRRYTHTHLKWFMGTSVFSTFPLQDFSFFYFLFSFLRVHKKHKNANKRISYFFPLRCFLSAFFIFVRLFAFCTFARLCFCALVLLVLFVLFMRAKSFCKKNKEFKTALITSFILLLNSSYCKHEFFKHYNFFQSLQSFSIITIFFNHCNVF